VKRRPPYPFEPKSTAYVRPGDFWAIPTRRGGWYCCGQILAIPDPADSRSVVVGLLDWCEPHPPAAEAIAGAEVLRHGLAHIKTVRETGGTLLGNAEPPVVDGLADPNLGSWGYQFIEELAHDYFGRHFPERPVPALERPAGIGG
jgi:hypothetical protein